MASTGATLAIVGTVAVGAVMVAMSSSFTDNTWQQPSMPGDLRMQERPASREQRSQRDDGMSIGVGTDPSSEDDESTKRAAAELRFAEQAAARAAADRSAAIAAAREDTLRNAAAKAEADRAAVEAEANRAAVAEANRAAAEAEANRAAAEAEANRAAAEAASVAATAKHVESSPPPPAVVTPIATLPGPSPARMDDIQDVDRMQYAPPIESTPAAQRYAAKITELAALNEDAKYFKKRDDQADGALEGDGIQAVDPADMHSMDGATDDATDGATDGATNAQTAEEEVLSTIMSRANGLHRVPGALATGTNADWNMGVPGAVPQEPLILGHVAQSIRNRYPDQVNSTTTQVFDERPLSLTLKAQSPLSGTKAWEGRLRKERATAEYQAKLAVVQKGPHVRRVSGGDNLRPEDMDYNDPDMFSKLVAKQRRGLESMSPSISMPELKLALQEAFVSFAVKFEEFIGRKVSAEERKSAKTEGRNAIAAMTTSATLLKDMTSLNTGSKSNVAKPAKKLSDSEPRHRWSVGMEQVARRYIMLRDLVNGPLLHRHMKNEKLTKEKWLEHLWLDEWDHNNPKKYKVMSSFTRMLRNPLLGNWDAFRHLHGQLAMMELLLDVFKTLVMDFSGPNMPWRGSFTRNVVATIRRHTEMYAGMRQVSRLHHKLSDHVPVTLTAAIGLSAFITSSIKLAEAVKDGLTGSALGGPAGGVGTAAASLIFGAFMVAADVKQKHGSRQLAEEALNQIDGKWLDAEQAFKDEAMEVMEMSQAPPLAVILPEMSMYAAAIELTRSWHGDVPTYLQATLGGASRIHSSG